MCSIFFSIESFFARFIFMSKVGLYTLCKIKYYCRHYLKHKAKSNNIKMQIKQCLHDKRTKHKNTFQSKTYQEHNK